MSSVKLVRRWGAHDAGNTVEVDDTMAAWLVGNSYAEDPARPGTASAGVSAPGTHGADLRAGGDLSRPGVPQWQRSSRTEGATEDNPEGNHVNRAARAHGAPRAGGPVVLEDQGKAAKGEAAKGEVKEASTASGKSQRG